MIDELLSRTKPVSEIDQHRLARATRKLFKSKKFMRGYRRGLKVEARLRRALGEEQ